MTAWAELAQTTNLLDKEATTSYSQPIRRPGCDTGLAMGRTGRGQLKRSLKDSPLRPKVPADRRLFLWHGVKDGPIGATLHPLLRLHCRIRMINGFKQSSLATYGSGIKKWHVFCDSFDVDEERRLPADPDLIVGFVCWAAGDGSKDEEELAHIEELKGPAPFAPKSEEIGEKAIGSYLAALRAWHIVHGWGWSKANQDTVHLLRRAAARIQDGSHLKDARPPVTPEMLIALNKGLDFSSPFDVATWACALASTFGLLRSGEAVGKSRSKASEKAIKRSQCILAYDRSKDGKEIPRFELQLADAKTAKPGELQFTALFVQRDPVCPVAALARHLRINGPFEPNEPLFSYHSPAGRSYLAKDTFLARCNRIWVEAGLPTLSGHCFRIGGASIYLANGAPMDLVKKMGRWKSDAVLFYIRNWERVLPHHFIDPSLRDGLRDMYQLSTSKSSHARKEKPSVKKGTTVRPAPLLLAD